MIEIKEALRLGKGRLSSAGALVVETGSFTGRAADLRFVVRRKELEQSVDWGPVNQSVPYDFSNELFSKLEKKLTSSSSPTYKMRGYVGPYEIQVHSTSAWHVAFAKNMFREKSVASLSAQVKKQKAIQVFHDPYGKISDLGMSAPSETVIVLDPVELKVAIVGTAYAGEIKKSAFTLCNFLLPEENIFSMHASANCLPDGSQSCVLFGLSGTGKTTLSASSNRSLIGDDEIVWSENGLTNLEGGCYAKLIDLDPLKEPEIFKAVNSQGAILENVACDEKTGEIDFADRTRTENTRGSYSLSALDSIYRQDVEAQAPKTIIFLTADAFGALPAVAQLNPWQAQYHFLSGYTAKVAGTEMGVKEPKAAFSACFGAPFMPRHPGVYAKMLGRAIEKHGSSVWLLNTGWTNGGYGKGSRFPIAVSRKLLENIQSGELEKREMLMHPIFGFKVPKTAPGVEAQYLEIPTGPAVKDLAKRFSENIKKFIGTNSTIDTKIVELGGPKV